MLDVAINHIDELKKKFNSIWFQEKYKFYNYDMWFNNMEVDDNTWNRHQFVSLNNNSEIIGYIAYQVERQTHNASKLAIINFTDNKIVFGRDLKQVLVDIFEKFKFNKLSFSVVIGNPIEKSYDKMVKKYGGWSIGISSIETKLYDNEWYSVKYYEIYRENYMRKVHPELFEDKNDLFIYNCAKTILYPPENFITYNCCEGYKTSIQVDDCLSEEIKDLWSKGIKTTGCCCGHGMNLGFIEVTDDCIKAMEELGYVHKAEIADRIESGKFLVKDRYSSDTYKTFTEFITDKFNVDAKIQKELTSFMTQVQKDIDKNVADMFNATTQAALSSSILNLLMQNDTFLNMQDSVKRITSRE